MFRRPSLLLRPHLPLPPRRLLSAAPDLSLIYKRKTPLQHILLRPSMYIGSTTPTVVNNALVPTRDNRLTLSPTPITSTPALVKVLDEILLNAVDATVRNPALCTSIAVTITPTATPSHPPSITVVNDGPTIPITMHPVEKIWLPELLMGNLLTGSNFNDEEGRITGGRHGYGAKLTNIFSKMFTIDCHDGVKNYRQSYSNNMRVVHDPTFDNATPLEHAQMIPGHVYGSAESTTISFVPDLEKLVKQDNDVVGASSEANGISDGDYGQLCKRVIDVAACNPGTNVSLNGSLISFAHFSDYPKMFFPPPASPSAKPPSLTLSSPRWDVIATTTSPGVPSPQVSFVNSVHTVRGGTHVNYVNAQLADLLLPVVKKKSRMFKDLTAGKLIKCLSVFVRGVVQEPDFDTQSKECLTSISETWGSAPVMPKDVMKRIEETSLVEDLVEMLRVRDAANIGTKIKAKRGVLAIAKLDDANFAGSGESCQLILTEGDSAKALAVSGLSVVGRDRYGVFPLRGKVMNVRDVSSKTLTANTEIKNLVQILGLDFKKTYKSSEELATLRYSGIIIMADQDNDGTHIKGLLLNFFRVFWPALLHLPGFMSQFITPIVKARLKSDTFTFFSQQEFSQFLQTHPNAHKYSIKYYKGLGTSTSAEGKEYFENLPLHLKLFSHVDNTDDDAIDMAFDKKHPERRRDWILDKFDANTVHSLPSPVRYRDFVDHELVNFSNADNIRSIPSVIDGLKPSQRKVLFGCFKRKQKAEVKVAQLAGYIAEHTAYHHGEMSLYSTIVGMAQDYVGANNVPLLSPNGQFGTRLSGGKDSASPRYIFTQLQTAARKIFPEADDSLLASQFDDGQPIEPVNFAPIIPLLLVNGAQGIGTGWATSVPKYHPLDVVNSIRAKLNGDAIKPLSPHYNNFKGEIVPEGNGKGSYLTRGIIEEVSSKEAVITELPVGTWTSNYKEFLFQLQLDGVIKNFSEHHTTDTVKFVIGVKARSMKGLMKNRNKTFRLETRISTSNMNAFNVDGEIVKYESPADIIDEFFEVRLELYGKRKEDMERKMEHAVKLVENKARFIEAVVGGDVNLLGGELRKEEVVTLLDSLGFDRKGSLDKMLGSEEEAEGDKGGFEYLLSTPVGGFTRDKIEALRREKGEKVASLEALRGQSKEQMWLDDLDELEKVL